MNRASVDEEICWLDTETGIGRADGDREGACACGIEGGAEVGISECATCYQERRSKGGDERRRVGSHDTRE